MTVLCNVFFYPALKFQSRIFIFDLLSCGKGIAAGFAAAICSAVAYFYHTGLTRIVFGVMNTVLYRTMDTVFCFAF